MNRRTALALLASSLWLSGCEHPPYRLDLLDLPTGSAYTLASGDRLRIIVFGQVNLSNIYAVDGAGRISMPLIGLVPVAGRTTVQVEEARRRSPSFGRVSSSASPAFRCAATRTRSTPPRS